MNLLLDENLSPRLISRLSAKGVPASHIAHLGRSGLSDPDLWQFAFESDRVVATINARDFLTLAANAVLHPGLIVLRVSSLSVDQQWAHLEPAIDFCLAEEAAGRDLVNRVIEIRGPNDLDVYDLPAP